MTLTTSTTRTSTRAALAVLILFLSGTTMTWAASQRPLGVDELAALSDEIVVGSVVETSARWEGRLIVTDVTIDVTEALRGGFSNRLELTQLGGTAVHPQTGLSVTMTASTQATLLPGEEVLLFVSRTRAGGRQLVGGAQGKFSIRVNARTGRREIPVGPKRLVAAGSGDQRELRPEVMTLDAMRERIRR